MIGGLAQEQEDEMTKYGPLLYRLHSLAARLTWLFIEREIGDVP
jgi:hypothetical protein